MPLKIKQITRAIFLLTTLLLVGACSDGSDSPRQPTEPLIEYDFSEVDARFQTFLDDSEIFDGISVVLVDKDQGVVHEAAFGDHTLDVVVLLASTSKFAVATLMMALADDESLDFDVESPIGDYLPWNGVYGDRTTTQLLSNTSGIPGVSLNFAGGYGVHECQYDPEDDFENCAQLIYATELPGTKPAGTVFDYGGSQWQLAGAVAEQVSNSNWAQVFDEYLATPCGMEVFEFGNMPLLSEYVAGWTGHPDSLSGRQNPQIGGGAVSNLSDYAKLLLLHLNGGVCDGNRVLSGESVSYMQVDRGVSVGTPYAMGMWITGD